MKKYLLIVALFFVGILFACSQNSAQEKRVSKIMNNLQQACQLTPDQVTKIQPMVQSFVNTGFENKKQYASDPNSLKSANETNRKNFKANLGTVLTADQLKQFEAYNKQKKAEKQSGGQEGGEENQ